MYAFVASALHSLLWPSVLLSLLFSLQVFPFPFHPSASMPASKAFCCGLISKTFLYMALFVELSWVPLSLWFTIELKEPRSSSCVSDSPPSKRLMQDSMISDYWVNLCPQCIKNQTKGTGKMPHRSLAFKEQGGKLCRAEKWVKTLELEVRLWIPTPALPLSAGTSCWPLCDSVFLFSGGWKDKMKQRKRPRSLQGGSFREMETSQVLTALLTTLGTFPGFSWSGQTDTSLKLFLQLFTPSELKCLPLLSWTSKGCSATNGPLWANKKERGVGWGRKRNYHEIKV